MIDIHIGSQTLAVSQTEAKIMNMFGLISYDLAEEKFTVFAGVTKTALERFLTIWGER